MQRPQRKRKLVSYIEEHEDDTADEATTAQAVPEIIVVDDDDDDDFSQSRSGRASQKKRKKTKQSKQPKQRPFRFLDLPAELRNEIYKLVLVDNDHHHRMSSNRKKSHQTVRRIPFTIHQGLYTNDYQPTYQGDHTKLDSPRTNELCTQLLRVCNQIKAEAAPILYGQMLLFEDSIALHDFLTDIGVQNQQLLTHVVICQIVRNGGNRYANYAAFASLRGAVNLQELQFDCWLGWLSSAKKIAGNIYLFAHHFFEAYGHAHARKDAALDILKFTQAQFSPRGAFYQHSNLSNNQVENMAACQRELQRMVLSR